MGFLDCASVASAWRGYDYYEKKKVLSLKEIEDEVYAAKVSGSSGKSYSVELHLHHPRKSKCNCPHANGKRIVCKHMIATYFHLRPSEAAKYHKEVIAYQEEEERREEELADKVCRYVWKMKKADLQQALLQLLFDGSEWQYEKFIEEHGIDD